MSSASKIVLITGANQGIGYAIAKSLSSKPGYHVLLGSRNTQRGVEAAKKLADSGLKVEPITIDVTSDDSIAAAAEEVLSKFGHLDILINNAGVSLPETNLTPSALRQVFHDTFAVNTFGAALTTEAFIPLLSAAPHPPRIVFLSSILASCALRPGMPVSLPVYRSSKAALNMLMLHYAVTYKEQGWKVNATCAGWCATNLNGFAGANTPESGAINAVRLATLGEDGETGTYSNKEGPLSW